VGQINKFPRTPHVLWLGSGKPRDDKVLSDSERTFFLNRPITVEEKVDGANLGLYVDKQGQIKVQNRGTLLQSGKTEPQFEPLWSWLWGRKEALTSTLADRYVLYGEWCFARHSVFYSALPDWFLGFDILDVKAGVFLDTQKRNNIFRQLHITPVPAIAQGRFSEKDLISLLEKTASRLGAEEPEGLYLRREEDGRITGRAKLVRSEFHANLKEHWSRRALEKNWLAGREHSLRSKISLSSEILP
jgi:hypothetical protein